MGKRTKRFFPPLFPLTLQGQEQEIASPCLAWHVHQSDLLAFAHLSRHSVKKNRLPIWKLFLTWENRRVLVIRAIMWGPQPWWCLWKCIKICPFQMCVWFGVRGYYFILFYFMFVFFLRGVFVCLEHQEHHPPDSAYPTALDEPHTQEERNRIPYAWFLIFECLYLALVHPIINKFIQ